MTTIEQLLTDKADELRTLGLCDPISVSACVAPHTRNVAAWTVHGTIDGRQECWVFHPWDEIVQLVTHAIGPKQLTDAEKEMILAM